MTDRTELTAIDPKTADLAALDHAARRMRSYAIRTAVARILARRAA